MNRYLYPVLVLLFFVSCARVSENADYAAVARIAENDDGTAIALLGYPLRVDGGEPVMHNGVFYVPGARFVQQPSTMPLDQQYIVRQSAYELDVRGSVIVLRDKENAYELESYNIPLKADPGSELKVSRYYGKKVQQMRIEGDFPGGVMMREPERLMPDAGVFADAWFPVTPQGVVGAELVSPFPALENRVLYLSTTGIAVFTAHDTERQILWFADGHTGKVLLVLK
jgi:hypothetical protein